MGRVSYSNDVRALTRYHIKELKTNKKGQDSGKIEKPFPFAFILDKQRQNGLLLVLTLDTLEARLRRARYRAAKNAIYKKTINHSSIFKCSITRSAFTARFWSIDTGYIKLSHIREECLDGLADKLIYFVTFHLQYYWPSCFLYYASNEVLIIKQKRKRRHFGFDDVVT